jgi:hypothetical protein
MPVRVERMVRVVRTSKFRERRAQSNSWAVCNLEFLAYNSPCQGILAGETVPALMARVIALFEVDLFVCETVLR